ncbi:MAG: hypothetical protein H9901_03485 [Candidatus Paralactobacillus gallistercoris]|uniref:Uncharacterized protein n=1 Tax=Candidatus Paralactobacillus gallistercoris TaxID=2838724 RepID=A0A948TJV2_9LACO|nr:hypothetical protein [Candidatus Paralactobacillus gallistercoris]
MRFKRKSSRASDNEVVATHDFSQIVKQASEDRQHFKKVQAMFNKFKKTYSNNDKKD